MVDAISTVITEYQRRLINMPYVPATTYGRAALGKDGVANELFLTFLFSDKEVGVQFLKDVGLLRSKVTCNTCGRDMTWNAERSRKDGFRWRCRRRTPASVCSTATSIRYGSWFQQSNLNFMEAMILTYDIVRRVPAHIIQQGHQFGSKTIAD
jgi:hypothetical protein